MQIIQRRHRVETKSNIRCFSRKTGDGGFRFDCDAHGNLLPTASESIRESFEDCLAHPELYLDEGVSIQTTSYYEPSIGLCEDCKREVYLTGFTNTCRCGADYNTSGTRLAPREQWGEETGESISDILAADTDSAFD